MTYLTTSLDQKLVELLQNGAVGLLPSDTIYGLSGRAEDEKAVGRIYGLKGRKEDKPLIILIADTKMLDLLSIDKSQADEAFPYWPGPLTIIFDAPNSPSRLHRDTKTLAVRIPNHPELLKLLQQTGPLISTSANPEGQSPAKTVAQAKEYFGDKLDFYVDVGKMKSEPSTIAKLSNGKLEVVRPGKIKL